MTNKIILSTLTSLLIVSNIYADDILKDINCGDEFNQTTFKSIPTKREKNCQIIPIKQEVIQKIVKIKNYQELFSILGLKNPYRLYHDKKYKKILDDFYINDYTLTFLFYKRVTNFKNILENPQENNNSKLNYIQEVDLGGEYVALIHIKTNSQEDYKKTAKKLTKKILSFSNIDKLQSIFTKLLQTHDLRLKEYITDNINIEKSYNLQDFFTNIKTFEHNIKYENQPITFSVTNPKYSPIHTLLKYYHIKNNLYYIKTHPKEFQIKDPLYYAKAYDKITKKLTKMSRKNIIDENLSLPVIQFPKRYEASLEINPIHTKAFSYHIKSATILKTYPRIDEKSHFTMMLQLQLDIQRNGKVLIETIHTTIKENNKVLIKEEDSHIKLDTYVNFPKLRFSKIKKFSYGIIETTFIFDKYEKEKKVKGTGLIEEATCGYKIDKSHKIDFSCKNIVLKPLDIEFSHDK